MIKICIVWLMFCLFSLSPIYADYLEDQQITFRAANQDYRVKVIPTAAGCDIVLEEVPNGPDIPPMPVKTLSTGYDGEHLFPMVTVNPDGDNFVVGWISHQRDKDPGHIVSYMYLYDSGSDTTRPIRLDGFKSASPLQVIPYEGNPHVLVFLGNNSDNTDIFYYTLTDDRVVNLTNTPDSEREFRILNEKNRFFVETKTHHHHYRYRIKKRNLKNRLTEKREIVRHVPIRPKDENTSAANTIVGFGDSITWGTIRMNIEDPDDFYHPEWAYLTQLKEMLQQDYNTEFTTINKGVPGERANQGLQRIHDDLAPLDARYIIVMFGTNDVPRKNFDLDGTLQDLEHIVTTARDIYHMSPVISTIPPQKDEQNLLPGIQYFIQQTEALNAGIIDMAQTNNVRYIDTYTAFFTNENDWQLLLEAYRGNHPSPLGHQVMAELFKAQLIAYPPAPPTDIEKATPHPNQTSRAITWTANDDFDFSHYNLEFGYSPENLNRKMTPQTNSFTFYFNPLHAPNFPKIYYRIQSVDLDGNASAFTEVKEIELYK